MRDFVNFLHACSPRGARAPVWQFVPQNYRGVGALIQLFFLYPRIQYYSTGFAMVAFFVIALGEQHEAPQILTKISPILEYNNNILDEIPLKFRNLMKFPCSCRGLSSLRMNE